MININGDTVAVTMSDLKDDADDSQLEGAEQLGFDKTFRNADDEPKILSENNGNDWQDTDKIAIVEDIQPLKLTDVLDITDTTHLVEGNATSSINSVGQNSSCLHNCYSSDVAELLVNVDMNHHLIV